MTLRQLQLSKTGIWKKIERGIWREEDVAKYFSAEELPAQLINRWKQRSLIKKIVQRQGIHRYAQQPEFEQSKNIQRLLNQLHYSSGSDYRTQSAELTLKNGAGHCLEGALVAAYFLECKGYTPQLLTLNFGFISHALCIVEDKTGFQAWHKRRRTVPEKLKLYSSLEKLADDFIRQYQREDYRTVKWGIGDLADLSLDWRYGWKSRGGYVEKLERHSDEITSWTHI